MKVEDRFIKYVKINTTSNENNENCPSTDNQMILGRLLVDELNSLGLSNVYMDKNGYVYGTLPKNTDKVLPTVGFIAHIDTSPDFSSENVNPIFHRDYDGGDILLSEIKISPNEFKSLSNYVGDTIITSDGKTLLGADDKAGIAEIITALEIIKNKDFPHGDIKVGFTPDEEIGRGADLFDVKGFNCDFAYTMDGGRIGELEFENFNAGRFDITITGKSVHPGYAKNIMKNAVLIGNEFLSLLPKEETPQTTEGYEGFYHVIRASGGVSSFSISLIVRDFDWDSFNKRMKFIEDSLIKLNNKYPNSISFNSDIQYKNMSEIIKKNMNIIDIAKEAFINSGINPNIVPIRGGTDGARLSFMGLPCPNIFAGGHNFHGPYEFIPVSSMEVATNVIVEITRLIGIK